MKSLNNVGAERLGDAPSESIDDGAKLSIISSYFTVFAYGELKEELFKVDEVRFLFSEPTFIKRMADSKEPREFEVARRAREDGVGGSGLELTLRNNLNQRAFARECAEWIREKGVFKSAKTSGAIQPGGTYVVENSSGDDYAFMGAAANFTQESLGYERRPGTVTCVSHFENATEAVGLKNAWKPDATGKSLYNYVVYDSAGVERSFAEALDKQEEVLVFAKLPSAFKIDTPLGSYNPDWAYVEEADGERRVYFVTETKGGKNGEPALRDAEKIKIGCAKKHFEALDLGNDFRYNVRTTYQYEAVKA